MTALDTDERAKVRGRRAGEALLAGFEDASEENRPSPPTNLEDQVVVPVRNIVPMSDQADPLQLSMIGINPATAHLLLSRYVSLMPGDWIGLL